MLPYTDEELNKLRDFIENRWPWPIVESETKDDSQPQPPAQGKEE